MRLVVVRVGREPVVEDVEDSYRTRRTLVGGPLDRFALDAQADCWFNDEFLVLGLPPNRLVTNQVGERWPICGDFFVAGHDGRGNTVSLTPERARSWAVRISRMPKGLPR